MTIKRVIGKLAISGGAPVMSKLLPPIHNIGLAEYKAVKAVMLKGPLSGFLGVYGDKFLGGTQVKNFEKEFSKKFKVKYSVAFNSATTALHAAINALGIGPGDEVLVPPYSMSASATAILMNGAVPIFVDIDENTFCIDANKIEGLITDKTKAIMVVNLFGQTPEMDKITEIAKKYGLKIIEDNAQSPGAKWKNIFAGTIADVGIFSLNLHKTIQTGEGGMLVTNNDDYALRAQLTRNHGEVVIDDIPNYQAGPLFGSNYRMTEVTAAMGRIQLKKLDTFIKRQREIGLFLTRELKKIKGVEPAFVDPNCYHIYHRFAIKVNSEKIGISRDNLIKAMSYEGFNMSKGYVKPIYLLSIFQNKKIYLNSSFPFICEMHPKAPNYSYGICPVSEKLFENELTMSDVCQYPYTLKHARLFVVAIKKIVENKSELLNLKS